MTKAAVHARNDVLSPAGTLGLLAPEVSCTRSTNAPSPRKVAVCASCQRPESVRVMPNLVRAEKGDRLRVMLAAESPGVGKEAPCPSPRRGVSVAGTFTKSSTHKLVDWTPDAGRRTPDAGPVGDWLDRWAKARWVPEYGRASPRANGSSDGPTPAISRIRSRFRCAAQMVTASRWAPPLADPRAPRFATGGAPEGSVGLPCSRSGALRP